MSQDMNINIGFFSISKKKSKVKLRNDEAQEQDNISTSNTSQKRPSTLSPTETFYTTQEELRKKKREKNLWVPRDWNTRYPPKEGGPLCVCVWGGTWNSRDFDPFGDSDLTQTLES
ncbi:hypothetical protein AVEN_202635-1 [Araneus ventricosus]|uniref:Uncharacterized protein n=1 Tax=Araneus ventricosus TaxID=182803 RepID=A0A4Y2IVR3_ARAVE|nr:hypothetical protein AVEN_202635-1 [Araneus ventricosus]